MTAWNRPMAALRLSSERPSDMLSALSTIAVCSIGGFSPIMAFHVRRVPLFQRALFASPPPRGYCRDVFTVQNYEDCCSRPMAHRFAMREP